MFCEHPKELSLPFLWLFRDERNGQNIIHLKKKKTVQMLWILLSDSVIPYNSGSHRLADTLAIIFWLSFWRQHIRDGAQMILIFVPAQG